MAVRSGWLIAGWLLLAADAWAADPWHLPGWQARAIVEIPRPLAEPGVDTAGVKVICQGRAKPDGSDYRVLDAAGKPVPFQLTFHDAARYSLISFRVENPGKRFYIYFQNPQASRAAEQVAAYPPPGSGPPKGSWVPHYGMVLETLQRPEGENPQTIADMTKLIAGSKTKYGARYQQRIADGYNSFGPSDYYISLYRGWINIPRAGKYQFCTISNEASFSFIDGKELVHWPGRHTVERGIHGEKNASVELTAGLHYVEYYHEEVTLDQMAYLGWRPSADTGPFSAIPESVYTAPHAAVVKSYENPQGPLLYFGPAIADSLWPVERHEGQYTRCRFQVGDASKLAAGTVYTWNFGDGQSATGADVDHVYLAMGKYTVALTAQVPQGAASVSWPLEVFEIEHVTEDFKEGRLADYAKLVKRYDRTKLDATHLKELAHLLAESDDPATALTVGKEWMDRFAAREPKLHVAVRRLMADCAVRLGQGSLDEAIANYQASLTAETPAVERFDVLARLVRLIGIERGMPDKAAEVVAQIEETARSAKMDDETRRAYRRAMIASGDVLLWHGKVDGARKLYQQAEKEGPFIPSQVHSARVGSYPNSIRELIGTNHLGAALDIVNQWEETFPTEKLSGQTFFWRGKLLSLRGQPRDAARYLARSVGLATGAVFESEARWLLAQALEQLGKPEEAKKELAKLVAAGSTDEFARQAKAKLMGK